MAVQCLLGEGEGAAGGAFCVGGELSLPRAVPGAPAKPVLFQGGAGILVGLFVKEDLEPVRFQVADYLAAGELCAADGLLGLGLALGQFVQAGMGSLDLAPQAGQLVVGEGLVDPRSACFCGREFGG